jgi:hypothetical protein
MKLHRTRWGTGWAAAPAALAFAAAVLATAPATAESKAKDRLAANFEMLTMGGMHDSAIVPERDRKRTAKCLAQALVTDIPEEDAARLSDIFEGRVKSDPALQKKWLTISAKDAPARNTQVLQAVQKLCPDLGPYIKQMM